MKKYAALLIGLTFTSIIVVFIAVLVVSSPIMAVLLGLSTNTSVNKGEAAEPSETAEKVDFRAEIPKMCLGQTLGHSKISSVRGSVPKTHFLVPQKIDFFSDFEPSPCFPNNIALHDYSC